VIQVTAQTRILVAIVSFRQACRKDTNHGVTTPDSVASTPFGVRQAWSHPLNGYHRESSGTTAIARGKKTTLLDHVLARNAENRSAAACHTWTS